MDATASLALTEKGVEEVKRRTYKLGIRKRSVLLLLETPHSIEELQGKTVLHSDEFKLEIESLMREGFVRIGNGAPAAPAAQPAPTAPKAPSSDPFAALSPVRPQKSAPAAPQAAPAVDAEGFALLEDIILSEAKFLLVDYSVDSFGTRSQSFADEISACRSVDSLSLCLRKVHSETLSQCPERLRALAGVVKAINETA